MLNRFIYFLSKKNGLTIIKLGMIIIGLSCVTLVGIFILTKILLLFMLEFHTFYLWLFSFLRAKIFYFQISKKLRTQDV